MCHEQKEVNNEAVEEGQGLGSSEEYEPRFNEVTQDINTGPVGPVQVGEGLQIPQQQPQGNVRWDRFLPVRSLKVLLVENDDSTRHVVTALLRNCSYEVVAVGNGHQAWKILEDATNHIELVLTEVALPVLSGIGLLCKIVSHQNLKNIPVIMMSSHDSMSTVFKCLSKGAVDFLVKPIRKNELKNLWQHVWRRCHSSSGSGSESGTQTKKYVKSKGNDESENNSGSSEEHYGGSNGPSIRGGSDNGSGTQSSWTKRAAEDDRAQPTSPQTQWRDAPDSICAQVTDTKPEKHSNIEIHATEMKQFLEHADKLDNVSIGKDLELGVSKNLHLHYTYQQEKLPIHSTSKKQNRSTEIDGKPFDNGQLEQNGENLTGRTRNQAPNMVGAVFNCANPHGETRNFEKTSRLCDNPQIKPEGDSEGLPSLELTLKRLGGVGNVGNIASEDRNVLRHSGLSAFSKYNSASSSNQAPTANAGSCSPLENSPVAPNKATPLDFPSISNGTDTNHQPNENNCNNETTSTSKCTIPKPETINEKPESRSTFLPFHSSGASNSTQKAPMMGEDTKMVQAQATVRDSQPPVQVQHHHHHHHHYHHHLHSMQHHQPEQTENNDITLNNMEETAQHCGSSNDFGGNIESNAGNYSVNGSASGSNHVSNNGQNGNRIAVNAGARNVQSDNGVVGINSGSGVDKDRAAQREAALNKFRQKRKERCFEKKVNSFDLKMESGTLGFG